ncbi:MAG: flavodoxin domain-containing protein [Candidatus Dojkabacteria bacterium]|jgi:menaquinone-dependent protoporphyrinogen IX oxidase
MNTVIIYKSKHGSTQEYAEYINKNIPDSEIFSVEEFDINTLDSYENIILGSSVYAGVTFYNSFLINNWDVIKDKNIFVFAVGILPANHPSSESSYKHIPTHIRNKIQYIKLPGRIVFSKLNLLEKFIVKMINSKEKLEVKNMIDLQKANSVIFYFKPK